MKIPKLITVSTVGLTLLITVDPVALADPLKYAQEQPKTQDELNTKLTQKIKDLETLGGIVNQDQTTTFRSYADASKYVDDQLEKLDDVIAVQKEINGAYTDKINQLIALAKVEGNIELAQSGTKTVSDKASIQTILDEIEKQYTAQKQANDAVKALITTLNTKINQTVETVKQAGNTVKELDKKIVSKADATKFISDQISSMTKIAQENAKATKDYEDELADVKAKNEAIDKENTEIEKRNKDKKDKYEQEVADAQSKTKVDGYLSEVVGQPLHFEAEPNAVYTVSKAQTPNAQLKPRLDANTAKVLGNVDDWISEVNEPITVTYTGLENSSYNGIKIASVSVTYTTLGAVKGSNGKDNLTAIRPYSDPTLTVIYVPNIDGSKLKLDWHFYDAQGKEILPKGSLISFSSLDTYSDDTGKITITEGISGFDGRFIPITGSSVTDNGGSAYSIVNNTAKKWGSKFDVTEWDLADNSSPYAYYGAIVGQASGVVSFTSENSKIQGVRLNINSKILAGAVPKTPVYEDKIKNLHEPAKPTLKTIEYSQVDVPLAPTTKIDYPKLSTGAPTVDKVAIIPPAKLSVKYIDGDDQDKLLKTDIYATGEESETQRIDDEYDKSSSYDEMIANFEKSGYAVDTTKTDEATINSAKSGKYGTNQEYTIVLKHTMSEKVVSGKDAGTPITDKTVTQTIHYQSDAKLTPKENVQKFIFSATVKQTIDNVTGKVVKENAPVWSQDQTFKAIPSPKIIGYTADKAEVGANTIKHDAKDTVIDVVYLANEQKVKVQFVDIDRLDEDDYDKGTIIPETDLMKTGTSDDSYNNEEEINEQLKILDDKGYELVLMDIEADSGKFDVKDDEDQTYFVYLQHKHEVVKGGRPKDDGSKNPEYNRAVKLMVHYEGADDKTPATYTQSFEFESTVTYDQVTEEVIDAIWSDPQVSKEVETPKITGYKTTKPVIEAIKFDKDSNDVEVTVKYEKELVETYRSKPTDDLPGTGEEYKKLQVAGVFMIASAAIAFILNRRKKSN